MESRQSLVLCIVYALFLILGAVMFMFLEYEVSETRVVKEPPEWSHLKDLALQEDPPADEDRVLSLATWLPRACQGITNHTINSLVSPGGQVEAVRDVEHLCPHLHQEDVTVHVSYPWSFIDALYFSMTVTTTIGYGHISPTLAAGRIVCIIYSLVGIPLTGILLAWTSEFFGEQLFKLFKSKLDAKKQHSHGIIALATTIYIAIGFVVFIFVPGAVFMFLEEWTYIESIYFAYITLTTIGFGDFVTGKSFVGATLYVYQICVILWIMIGLGYWVMVANFITKALKSKRLQSSVLRSAEEMKKIMQQMGMKNHDPTFLRQHSKATVNLMLQLSNIIAVQGGAENGVSANKKEDSPDSPGTSSTAASSPPLSPMGIPGISALFGVGLSRTPPLSQLMGPMRNGENDDKSNEEYTTVTVSLL
ncbi:potassium channel subfamily K member 4-like isoform X2 [Panulirus ornatus]|uniref:potassium channel subfamily K member 4-like isoform X2 n=1 Tax=Panulirus ornatus TaxID=150431 RepID=UPI003A884EB1